MEKQLAEIAKPGALLGIIIALAEVIKQLGVPAKFIPLVDIALGVVISLVTNAKEQGIPHSVITGVALGLSSCGAFSGVKNFVT